MKSFSLDSPETPSVGCSTPVGQQQQQQVGAPMQPLGSNLPLGAYCQQPGPFYYQQSYGQQQQFYGQQRYDLLDSGGQQPMRQHNYLSASLRPAGGRLSTGETRDQQQQQQLQQHRHSYHNPSYHYQGREQLAGPSPAAGRHSSSSTALNVHETTGSGLGVGPAGVGRRRGSSEQPAARPNQNNNDEQQQQLAGDDGSGQEQADCKCSPRRGPTSGQLAH